MGILLAPFATKVTVPVGWYREPELVLASEVSCSWLVGTKCGRSGDLLHLCVHSRVR